MRLFSVILFLSYVSVAFAQSMISDILSPDMSKRLVVTSTSGKMEYEVLCGEEPLIGSSSLGISLADNTQVGLYDDITSVEVSAHQGVMVSKLSERAEQSDNYSQLVICVCNNEKDVVVTIRLYNEGMAVRYEVSSVSPVAMSHDNTSFDISVHNAMVYTETETESGYVMKDANAESVKSLTPFFATSSEWSFTFN